MRNVPEVARNLGKKGGTAEIKLLRPLKRMRELFYKNLKEALKSKGR